MHALQAVYELYYNILSKCTTKARPEYVIKSQPLIGAELFVKSGNVNM